MTASPTAVELAAACVYVEEAGPWSHIRIVPPGQEPHQAIHWTSAKAEDLPHQRAAVVAMLAPFIDLGMARGRLTPAPPSLPWRLPTIGAVRAVLEAQGHTGAPVEPPRDIAPEVSHMVGDDDDGEIG